MVSASWIWRLRDQNALLSAAGFAAVFVDTEDGTFGPGVTRALEVMMKHHEPYPLMAFDRSYEFVAANRATHRMLQALLGPDARPEGNVITMLFDPDGIRRFVVDWERVARPLLLRLQREALYRRRDTRLRELLSSSCAMAGVPPEWRTPNLEDPSEAVMRIQFDLAGHRLGFLTTVTVFQAPPKRRAGRAPHRELLPLGRHHRRIVPPVGRDGRLNVPAPSPATMTRCFTRPVRRSDSRQAGTSLMQIRKSKGKT